MFVPIALIWFNATKIFLALNQEPDLALHAGKKNKIKYIKEKMNNKVITR